MTRLIEKKGNRKPLTKVGFYIESSEYERTKRTAQNLGMGYSEYIRKSVTQCNDQVSYEEIMQGMRTEMMAVLNTFRDEFLLTRKDLMDDNATTLALIREDTATALNRNEKLLQKFVEVFGKQIITIFGGKGAEAKKPNTSGLMPAEYL